ncbi:MAG: class I SAM-dependent methyltransferase [Phycisphaerae bacterium]
MASFPSPSPVTMLFATKESWIGRFVENRRVLDLGCACHRFGRSDLPSLHAFITRKASHTLGVDYLPEEIEKMRAEGFDVLCANVETMDLGQTFEVVVAGDIIEHLNNPGAFLERVREHLEPGGLLLVTTPNPITLERFLRVLLRGDAGGNKEHTCWFTAKVLRQLAGRHGFGVHQEAYVNDTRRYHRVYRPQSKRKGTFRWLARTLDYTVRGLLWFPLVAMQTLLAVVRHTSAETLCMALIREDHAGE